MEVHILWDDPGQRGQLVSQTPPQLRLTVLLQKHPRQTLRDDLLVLQQQRTFEGVLLGLCLDGEGGPIPLLHLRPCQPAQLLTA